MNEDEVSGILDQGDMGSYRTMRMDFAKITQSELATRAAVSRPSVQAWETGRGVSTRIARKIRSALAEEIQDRRREQEMVETVGGTNWRLVERYVADIGEQIESGDLDPDTGVTVLWHAVDRIRSKMPA